MKRIAIIIVTYNSVRFIPDCFESLSRMRRDDLVVETMVIENRSTDETAAMLAKYDGLRVMQMEKNLGFAGGNNVGIRLALQEGFDYVYLLNHDTIVEPDFLIEAVRLAESDPRAGAVQSLLLLSPDTHLVNSLGNAVQFLGLGYCDGYRTPAAEARKLPVREIAYPSGAGVLMRTDVLAKVGLFDESYFMYHEDLDLGWRMRLAGWKNLLGPRSVVFHKYSFSKSIAKYYFMERNRYATLFKDCAVWTLIVLAPWLLLSEIGLFLLAVRGGWWREKLRVYGALFSPAFWSQVRAERAKIAKLRVVSDREIFRLYVPTISFQDVDSPLTKYVINPLMVALWAVLKPLIR